MNIKHRLKTSWPFRIVFVLAVVFVLGVIASFIAYANDEEPSLNITEPASPITVQSGEIIIKGDYQPSDANVWVNGEKINSSNGRFEFMYKLSLGKNDIEIEAGDWKRKTITLSVTQESSEVEKARLEVDKVVKEHTGNTENNQNSGQVKNQEAINLVVQSISANPFNINTGELMTKDNPNGEGVFVYYPKTDFNGTKRNILWLVLDGEAYALNSPSKETTPSLDWPRDAEAGLWEKTGLDKYQVTEAIEMVFGN